MRPVLITGGAGTLGSAFERACHDRLLAVHRSTRSEADITDPARVAALLDHHQPWVVINAAGYVRVDDAEADRARCYLDNVRGPAVLARACADRGVRLVSFSSDLVFDGAKAAPYHEHDAPGPLGVYGRTKLEAERQVLALAPDALVVRTSAFFGPWDEHNFVTRVLRELAAGRDVRAANDTVVSPTYVPDLVHACLDLAIDGATGLWHLVNDGHTTWAEFARTAAALAGHRIDQVVAVPGHALAWRAPRPAFSVLGSARGALLPRLEDALRRYLIERPQPMDAGRLPGQEAR